LWCTSQWCGSAPRVNLEDEDEFANLRNMHSSITELRSQIEAFREYIEQEFAVMKNELQHIAGCADFLVLSAPADALPKNSDAVNPDALNSRSHRLLLLTRAVFSMADVILREGTQVMTEEAFAALRKKTLGDVYESLRDNVEEDDNDILEHDSLNGVELRML
jgi:hypothetical protein